MNFNDFEKIVSSGRLERYLIACDDDEVKTKELYLLNIQLSQSFYAYVSFLEVALRNAIDGVLAGFFNDTNWLINQLEDSGFLAKLDDLGENYLFDAVDDVIRKYGDYATQDKIISEQTFGFWTSFFKRNCYKLLKGRVFQSFKNIDRGVQRNDIYNMLHRIRSFRNKIYHNEPICFNANGGFDLLVAKTALDEMEKILRWVHSDNIQLLKTISTPKIYIERIEELIAK